MGGGDGGINNFLNILDEGLKTTWLDMDEKKDEREGEILLDKKVKDEISNQVEKAYGPVDEKMKERRDNMTKEILKLVGSNNK